MPSTLLFCAFCGDLVFSTEAKRAAGDIAPWLAIKEEAANDIAPWLTGKEEEEDEEVTKGHEELLAAEEEEKEEEEEEDEEEPVRRWTRVMNSLGGVGRGPWSSRLGDLPAGNSAGSMINKPMEDLMVGLWG
ncbi:hypothetical protein U1Q18_043884 [Sarracenia purpurea var. burkii]